MARAQQLSPGNYKTSAVISAEFENLIRYLNAAELGNFTVGELLAKLFNANGVFDGPIEMRKVDAGLQYRVGEYTDDATGWETLISLADLRGPPGALIGTTEISPISAPVVTVATANQTIFNLAHNPGDQALVWRNGVLQRPTTDYTLNPTAGVASAGAVIMTSPQPLNTVITTSRVRVAANQSFVRTDTATVASQAVFPVPAALATSDIQVYYNGLLQREGGSADYTRQTGGNTITFNVAVPTSNLITILGFAVTAVSVPGIMLESNYVDPASGLISLARILIGANAIANDRVNGLAPLMTQAARLHIGALPPADPTLQRLWIDTGTTPASFKVWSGVTWLRTSIENLLPLTTLANAGQFLRVNLAGDGYELGNIDLSSVIPRTWRGAANGVASLDATGRIPSSQLPEVIPAETAYLAVNGAVSGGTTTVKRYYGQRLLITGFSGRLSSGSINAQLSIGGVAVGPVFGLSSTPVEQPLGTPIEIDASTSSRLLAIALTSPSGANNLEVSLACRTII